MFLIPPKVYVKARLVKDNEVWQVNRAIYGLEEAPLLWAKERDRKLKELTFQVPKCPEERGKDDDIDENDEYYLKRLQTDVNTWHILKKGEKKSFGILPTYVDDLMVVSTEEIGEAFMKKVDEMWKCLPEEVVKENSPPVNVCGICIEKIEDGYFIHQKPYIKDLFKKNRLEDCNATKIILDKDSDKGDKCEEESEQWKQWKESPDFLRKVREAQKIAGEIMWLSTRTRPDLRYPI